jgi:Glutaredoxin-like domain (DUF836)
MIVLTVLSRPDCHLCQELVAELAPLVAGKAQIEIVDISDDDELSRQYLFEIPVLLHGDRELARHRLDRERIDRFIEQLDS